MRSKLTPACLALCLATACGAPKAPSGPAATTAVAPPAPASSAPDAVAPATTDDAAPPVAPDASAAAAPDEAAEAESAALATLAHELEALAARRAKELEAQAPEREPDANLFALGPCVRPDAEQSAALAKRVTAWIAKALHARLGPDDQPDLRYGCVDPAGVIVRAQIDRPDPKDGTTDGSHSTGHWWVLAVGPSSIRALAEVHGMAMTNWMEWATEASLDVVALVDLDHDGSRDPVMSVNEQEGGAMGMHMSFRTARASGTAEVGEFYGIVTPARLQPDPANGTIVVLLDENSDQDARHYRCIDAGADWSECPAAARAERFDRALAATAPLAADASDWAGDQDALAETLELLDVPAPEREALVARARPSTAAQIAARLSRERHLASTRPMPDQVDAADHDVAVKATAALRSALGDAACGELDAAATKAATAAVARFVAGHEAATLASQSECAEKGSCRAKERPAPVVTLSCAGADGALLYATWEDRFPSAAEAERGFSRGTLFWFHDGAVTAVIDRVEALKAGDMGGLEGPDGGPLVVKASLHGGHATALVASLEGELSAVVDGAVTGQGSATADPRWWWGAARARAAMRLDPLARSEAGDTLTFWRASPQGVVAAATFPKPKLATAPAPGGDEIVRLLVESERRLLADDALDQLDTSADLSGDEARAELVQALLLTDTDPAVIAKVRARLPH